MNQMIIDKLSEEIQKRVMKCIGMEEEAKASSTGISRDELAKQLDCYFDDITDGRREMPSSLAKLLAQALTGFMDISGKGFTSGECADMASFWNKVDTVRSAQGVSKNERIKEHFPNATPEEMMVLKQLGTEKSMAEHAKALGMAEADFNKILNQLA